MAGRVLELRVHGVSNTPPDELLGLLPEPGEPAPQPWLVAGDDVTGFYRHPRADPDEPVTVEAYSWGRLTSGARTARDVERALWTVLLPFTLANVALHARPEIPADPDRERWSGRAGVAGWLIRLFCLSLTGTLVLAATGVGVDLIGWQCVDRSCLRRVPGPWEFLGHGWWSEDAHALAVGLLVPLALIALVGLLSWRTYQYEAEMPVGPGVVPPVGVPMVNPLQDPTFWCGEGQLRRAAVLHLCTGTAVAAAVPLGAVLVMDPPAGPRAALAGLTVILLVLPVAVAVVALGRPYLTRRGGRTPLGPYSALVVVSTLGGLAGTFALLLLPDGPAGIPLAELRPPRGCAAAPAAPGCRADHSLPGYDELIAGWGVGQLFLLVAIGTVSRSGRRALVAPAGAALALVAGVAWWSGWLPGLPATPEGLALWMLVGPAIAVAGTGLLLPRATPVDPPEAGHAGLAWGGRGPMLIAGLGWLLAVAYCTGAVYWVGNRLNPADRLAVVPPVPVTWAGLVFGGSLLVVLATAVHAGVLFARLRRREYARLSRPGHRLSAHDLRRCRDVSTFRALHRLVGEHAIPLVGWGGTALLVLAALGCVAALSGVHPHGMSDSGWSVLVDGATDAGDRLLGWLPVLVATLGLLVYRNDTVRRSVGVLWDVGTFWPRTAHPFAPPSYAERAVPELQTRTAGLLALPEDDPRRVAGIILSGHSQGAVICAAVLLQLPARWRRRVRFFSYGCQLTRLYGRVFPAYFGPRRLPVLADALTDRHGRAGWTNFWRETDPLGWPVPAARRQVTVRDPEGLHPTGGEVVDPPIRSHGGYPDSPEFLVERERVAAGLRGAVPSPREGVG
ncbi:hypothetical protein CA850_08980 [Micromonospora echinospora]|uniref:Integral membrane protein n=1 Tax=Micromonospora echinospora TaxID=1877 RepID=A0A1C4XGT1_MICEC|nr:hypothetical protein [Micromonospora echinospora]OZV82407.1 hypothetical protein CA850_08980 [Micromonospora echinospora]SCF07567.1 hypothetical protein GA0070618_3034 [Micromonospora echinospora]